MVWSDFEICQSFIVENKKQRVNFNTGFVTNVTWQEVASNRNIFKQVLENSLNEFGNTRSSQDVKMRIC